MRLVPWKCWPTVPLSICLRRERTLHYSNPKIPEGINASREHPLKEFIWLAGGILATVLAVVLVLGISGGFLAKQIPFSKELEWASDLSTHFSAPPSETSDYLQNLAERLLEKHPLPKGITITIHYDDGDTINAFATLGGNIVIYRGLMDYLESENALAMVLAHEIAHVRERHPIESLGRAVPVTLLMALLSSSAGGGSADILSTASMLTLLNFSRSQEAESDAIALEMVADLYGHVAGADVFFTKMQSEESSVVSWVPEFAQTHPINEERVAELRELENRRGWSGQGDLTPLQTAVQ